MKFRIVAIPLFAAICLASPAISSAEQVRKGKGYSPRGSGESGGTSTRSGSGTATKSGGDSRSGGGDRTATTSNRAERRTSSSGEERRAASRPANEGRSEERAGNDDDRGRYAVPRSRGVVNTPRYDDPRGYSRGIATRDDRGRGYYNIGRNDYPRININIGSSYGGHYAPVHYDYWARQYLRWSPVRYAPWSLIYGSIGFPNYGYYGGVGPSPFYYGYNGYGWSYGPGVYSAYPTYAYPHEAGAIRLKIHPRDAQVFIDGYYAGRVDDFDGVFQSLKLEAGGHKVEIRMPGFEDLELDVHVQPGRTLTIDEYLRPRP